MGNSRDKILYDKTKYIFTGWFNRIYKRIQKRNRVKFGQDLSFDRWEFEKWIIENNYDVFFKLFKNWSNYNYESDLSPCIDRIDFTKPYDFINMQLLTWKENSDKGNIEKKIIGNKHMTNVTKKAVNKYSIDGDYINTYESLSEASRQNGISSACICEGCKGVRKSSKGYRWTYA